MKTKIYLLLTVCTVTLHSFATNYVLKPDMTSSGINFVNQTLNTNSTGATIASGVNSGWVAVYLNSSASAAVDFLTMSDPDLGSGQGDVIQLISSSTKNSGVNSFSTLSTNARLIQRFANVPVGTYTLKFKAKAINSSPVTLVALMRQSANSLPVYVLDGYDEAAGVATGFKNFTPDQTWTEYVAYFDLTRTVTLFTASATTTSSAGTSPSICFQILSTASGQGVLIDDVSLTAGIDVATQVEKVNMSTESIITAIASGNSQVKVDNVKGKVSIYNSCGTLIDQKTAVNNSTVLNVHGKGVYIISNGENKLKIII